MFSGVVKIADIDDYITPSQNCIKPLLDKAKEDNISEHEDNLVLKEKDKGKMKISLENLMEMNSDIKPDLIKFHKSTKTAKVSLNDCLACNGCVTTAETVLIEQQSVENILKSCFSGDYLLHTISVSPQSVFSLAEYFKISQEDCLEKLCLTFEKLNFK